MRKSLPYLLALLILGLLGGGYLYRQKIKNQVRYETVRIARGDLSATISATGTVNPVVNVLVGSQVSGRIKSLYADFNSVVRQGQIIAQIDPASFQAQVDQAQANLLVAEANVERARVGVVDAERTLQRNQELWKEGLIARNQLDTAQTNHDSSLAQLKAAQAQVNQARASLTLAETNLRYTTIHSPVDGIVISRNVDVGQTVVASLQAPGLFNIAQDLTQMQVNVNVDEADVGRVALGQGASFTVDAFPEIPFRGRVSQIRNAPVILQNVVTYDLIIRVGNPQLKLRPGMTANVSIVVEERKGILKVPNAALRFRPDSDLARKEPRGNEGGGKRRRSAQPTVWTLGKNGEPRPVRVELGISDGAETEIRRGALREGQQVIVEAISLNSSNDSARKGSRFGGARYRMF
ncbi:MAG: efflux RND transporter periplasmic adaptor subunit [Candidatus Tectomicrobia bacterium]|uniref:Efflux RND transporter periplasmic adaptor subunit n=1 Tax=Tectimicrobiota bacterium TaxID=2528274 RepID=A0A932CLC6_UNCTE|nr:efflux RND transporter periplasmic adaptor subunit [Candidatus Tectomicrobia bacterium]